MRICLIVYRTTDNGLVTHDNSLDNMDTDIDTEHDDTTDTGQQTDTILYADHDDIDLTNVTETHYNRKYVIIK